MDSNHSTRKAILVVSFGTSYNDNREATIGAVEQTLQAAFPEYELRRAFTSGMIIAKLRRRDGILVDSVAEAMERLLRDGVDEVLIQPTHVMNGSEYDDMRAQVDPYATRFASLRLGRPLLTDTADYQQLVDVIAAEIPVAEGEALVLVGHGSEHYANAAYAALSYHFQMQGHPHVFVGTVEGYPDLDQTIQNVRKLGVSQVAIAPLMVVAGDHANNDIASDEEDSWKSRFEAEGCTVRCILRGLGEYPSVRAMYVAHAQAAVPISAD